jgi:hypothetical protein
MGLVYLYICIISCFQLGAPAATLKFYSRVTLIESGEGNFQKKKIK